VLKCVPDASSSLLTARHRRIVEIADNAAAIQRERLQEKPEGWTKQMMEKHGH